MDDLIKKWQAMNPRQKDCIVHQILFDEIAAKKDTYIKQVYVRSDYYVKTNGIKKSLPFDTDHYLPPYTTDVNYAISIAEKLALTLEPCKENNPAGRSASGWRVGILNKAGGHCHWIKGSNLADTICLALYLESSSKNVSYGSMINLAN